MLSLRQRAIQLVLTSSTLARDGPCTGVPPHATATEICGRLSSAYGHRRNVRTSKLPEPRTRCSGEHRSKFKSVNSNRRGRRECDVLALEVCQGVSSYGSDCRG